MNLTPSPTHSTSLVKPAGAGLCGGAADQLPLREKLIKGNNVLPYAVKIEHAHVYMTGKRNSTYIIPLEALFTLFLYVSFFFSLARRSKV